MRPATSIPQSASATRRGTADRIAAHRYREPRVREILRRGLVSEHRAAAGNRAAQAA